MNQRSEVKCLGLFCCFFQEIKTGLGPSEFNQLSTNTDSPITPNRRAVFLVPSLSQRDIFGVHLSSASQSFLRRDKHSKTFEN